MEEKTLTFLGKDSGFGEHNNSAYIEDNNKLIIIDCGFTVFEQLKNKFDFNKYSDIEIIITHLHNDHAGSLSQIILYLWFIYNKKVTIYSKCERIRDYLEITGTPKESYEIKTESENITFIKTSHVQHLDAYGFKLKVKDKNIIYTGDTNTLNPFLPHIENEKIDELYVDVSRFGGAHLKIDDIVEKLVKINKSGTLVDLMHLDDKEYINAIWQSELLK